MKLLIQTGLAGFLAIFMSGCIVIGDRGSNDDWREIQRENRQIISDLEIGTSRDRVLVLLGAPAFSEAFSKASDDFRVLYYRTQHRHSDGDTTKDETTPLVFKNDRLIGWGQEMLMQLN